MKTRDAESTTLERQQSRSADGSAKDSSLASNRSHTDGFRDYRAPREHGGSLISPELSRVPDLLLGNRKLFAAQESFNTLRTSARRKLIDDAIRYTSTYREISWLDERAARSSPILMAGHQPALFHAGVWFKNFALSHLGQKTSSVAVNLVIDNDVASGSSVRVPTVDRSTGKSAYRSVAFDRVGGGVPYEQTAIHDREIFDHFDQALREAVAPLVKTPCVTELWMHARKAIARCGFAGCALAQARHGLEGDLGLQTLEVPLGVICRTAEFCEYVLMILMELPRFNQCYNEAARFYRAAHHIRSSSHPVPDLAEDGEWFEAPLWIYGNESPQRKAAWAKLSDDEIVISDRCGREIRVDIRYPKLAAESLKNLMGPDLKIRPRALMTTMYARMILSDLFLHGIGGGKYDQLGDMIIRSFFMVEPPPFMVISATVLLPGLNSNESVWRIPNLQRAIRDIEFQPERFADQYSMDPGLLRRKSKLLAEIPEKGKRRSWHAQVEQINNDLSESLRDLKMQFMKDLAQEKSRASAHALLASREHPFCVFPIDYLVETYSRLLKDV